VISGIEDPRTTPRVNNVRVSIVIPTRNGAKTLPAVLAALARQRADMPREIIAVDSGSTDGTLEILQGRVDRLIRIAPDDFNHGLTRNAGISHAQGELIVLLVQDAVPAGNDWLMELTAPLRSDERAAGAFARQVPRDDASAVTRWYSQRWLAGSEIPRTVAVANGEEFLALDPAQQFDRCIFDNVCSCVRRSVWAEHPLPATPIAEDIEWGRTVLLAGYTLVFAPKAVVVHSHDRSARYEFARTVVLHRRLFELFRLRTIPTIPALVRAIGSCIPLHLRCVLSERTTTRRLSGLGHGLGLAVTWPLAQYVGALSAIRGWKPFRTKMV
jgi:rhamnosyltransferase